MATPSFPLNRQKKTRPTITTVGSVLTLNFVSFLHKSYQKFHTTKAIGLAHQL